VPDLLRDEQRRIAEFHQVRDVGVPSIRRDRVRLASCGDSRAGSVSDVSARDMLRRDAIPGSGGDARHAVRVLMSSVAECECGGFVGSHCHHRGRVRVELR
jgi:hypothetical protein